MFGTDVDVPYRNVTDGFPMTQKTTWVSYIIITMLIPWTGPYKPGSWLIFSSGLGYYTTMFHWLYIYIFWIDSIDFILAIESSL